ncbi:RNA-binding domain-containing protein [Streptomyces sp. NPDC005209]|uniref:RNA-binding domain-containing protein n=1 Tax=Streptomyces sp. NPDC005209 TaxID=3156715 RepID=UPI0033B4CB86
MARMNLDAARSALRSNRPTALLGLAESGWLDAKTIPYELRNPKAVEELAKDVASFANESGGLLVMGVKTRVHNGEEVLHEIVPVDRSTIDVDRIRKIIRERVTPFLRHLDVDWSDDGSGNCVLFIDIPEQDADTLFVVAAPMGKQGKVSPDTLAVPVRDGAGTHWLPRTELQSMLKMSARTNRPRTLDRPALTHSPYDHARPVHAWSAQRLGVHPAISGNLFIENSGPFILPRYVIRRHDADLRRLLRNVVSANSDPTFLLVRGASCTGKTRTAFEAIRAEVPDDFDLLAPVNVKSLLTILDEQALEPRTVLWLDEAQEYLTGSAGEAVAAALLRRLDADGPLPVVATLWPEHYQALTHPENDQEDSNSNARKLLGQAHHILVPKSFAEDLEAARDAAKSDQSLAAALGIGSADVTQTLAAGPDLLDRYENPVGPSGVYGAALISAAMDACRFGVTGPLPLSFLEAAAPGYLTDKERASAPRDWLTDGLAYGRRLVKNTTAAFQEVSIPSQMGSVPGVVVLADYLQYHGRRVRQLTLPPEEFWNAARGLGDPLQVLWLAHAADVRFLYDTASDLYRVAADAGCTRALWRLAILWDEIRDAESSDEVACEALAAGDSSSLRTLGKIRREEGDWEGSERLYRKAIALGHTSALGGLAHYHLLDDTETESVYSAAIDAGHSDALLSLGRIREGKGDRDGAEELYLRAVSAGSSDGMCLLASLRIRDGDVGFAEEMALRAAEAGNLTALYEVARHAEKEGRTERASQLYQMACRIDQTSMNAKLKYLLLTGAPVQESELVIWEAIQQGALESWRWLLMSNVSSIERLADRAMASGSTHALVALAHLRRELAEPDKAKELYVAAVEGGDSSALLPLFHILKEACDTEAMEHLVTLATNFGADAHARHTLALFCDWSGDPDTAESHAIQAAAMGAPEPLILLAKKRMQEEQVAHAIRLYTAAADQGHREALSALADAYETVGNRSEAERYTLQRIATGNCDHNDLGRLVRLRRQISWPQDWEYMRRGLKPDGHLADISDE